MREKVLAILAERFDSIFDQQKKQKTSMKKRFLARQMSARRRPRFHLKDRRPSVSY